MEISQFITAIAYILALVGVGWLGVRLIVRCPYGNTPVSFRLPAPAVRPLGYLVLVLGSAIIPLAMWVFPLMYIVDPEAHYPIDHGVNSPGYLAMLLLSCAILLLRIAFRCLRPSAEELRLRDDRAPVLLLRPFAADDVKLFTPPVRVGPPIDVSPRIEEPLAAIFSHGGPMVTLSNPRKQLPDLGAARLHEPGPRWRSEVRRLLTEARLVIIMVGDSPSLLWEVRVATRRVPPERLLLYILRSSSDTSLSYNQVRPALERFFPRGLPSSVGCALFVGFQSDWTPVLIQSTPRLRFLSLLWYHRDAAKRAFEFVFGYPPRKGTSILARRRLLWLPPLVAGAIGIVGLFKLGPEAVTALDDALTAQRQIRATAPDESMLNALQEQRQLEMMTSEHAAFSVGDLVSSVLAAEGEPDEATDDLLRFGTSKVYLRDGRVSCWVERDHVLHTVAQKFSVAQMDQACPESASSP
jgi:hypothetical protein